ncbi:MAG TPA: response regulator [Thermoanaerobaculia bacterium]|nr:response regulator [Thermoanaerobaculia bacterium]
MSKRCGCRHEQFLELIEQSTDVIYETDALGHFTYANGAVRETLGYEPDLLIGRRFTDLVPNDHCETVVRQYRWQFDTRTPSTYFEFPALTADNRIVWFGQSVQIVVDENDRVTGFRAIARDITERRHAEAERQAIEERFRTFMDNIPAVAFVKDISGRFVYSNEVLRRMFGGGSRTPVNTESARNADREVIETRKPVQTVERVQLPDGAIRHFLACKFPVPSSNGVTYIGCVAVDITDRLTLETELATARDAALASARQKSEFLANMSHEIRTPMNGVLGLLGILVDGNLTPEQRDLAETARSSAESLLTIINDILDFSKIEAGKLTFDVVDFDVRKAVESVIDLLGASARRKSLEVGCVVDADVPRLVRGDPARFRQVLLNLVGNAIKFTQHGGVLVQVDRESESSGDVVLRCRVTDSGIGIASDVLPTLFQPFTQADTSTTRVFGGTGLGLAISRQLVELMGGEISVQTEPECGSSFTFTARLEHAHSTETDEESVNYPVPRVLLVDDSPTARQILALQLTAFGMPNDMADDSATALTMLRDAAAAGKPYDVVISDLHMPRTNGVTLARLVKADAALKRPRFILLTAMPPRFDAAQLADLGVTACITKPAKRQHLFSALLGATPMETAQVAPVKRDAQMGRLRILVVDDSAVNQKVATLQLEKLGYAADAVGNGLEALDALERIAYDAVLMDCQMPEMDGFAATTELRRRERGSGHHTPVIALTASATERDRERCLEAGMDDYVPKPTREATLAAALRAVTSRTDTAALSESRPAPATRPLRAASGSRSL